MSGRGKGGKVNSVATGLFNFSPDFVGIKTQKNPGIEN